MFDKVQKQIRKLNMISANDRIIVGLSGGADSVCLLLILDELRRQMGFSLEAVHVEHGIRGEESRQDARFAEGLCQKRNIVCQMVSVDVPSYAEENGLGFEEAARILRYEIFERAAKEKAAKIALAHHMEDNAETVLFQLARGSSLTGLCGMQPIRKNDTGVTYIRPLLQVHRSEIETYLDVEKQSFCVDGTNQELVYSRNYLRNVILPEFKKINKQSVKHINETAVQLSEIRGFLDEQIETNWNCVARIEGMCEKIPEAIVLDIKKLRILHLVLQKELIYKAIGWMAGGKKDISSVHVEQVIELLHQQSGKSCSLPNEVTAIKENEYIRFFYQKDKTDELEFVVSKEMLKKCCEETQKLTFLHGVKNCEIEMKVFENNISITEIPQKTYTKWMDYDKIKDGFCIRTRRSGDYLIYDAFSHRKKLKQYFVDEKIPVTKRDEMMVVAREDQVFWIVGGRMSVDVKVTEQTKEIIEVTIKEEL